MSTHEMLEAKLLESYYNICTQSTPDWAVRKRNSGEIVKPTIPFIGKHYSEQAKKILVYASAENLSDYWKDNDGHWPGDWLDCDELSKNRHRRCFDDNAMQENRKLPYVHCGPLEDGGLLAAVMYLAAKIRGDVLPPRDFYETIAFGNYGKFSIETPFQKAVKDNPQLSYKEKLELKKHLRDQKWDAATNKDYASIPDYLAASHEYIRADIETLKPDYLIMPNVDDGGFLSSVVGSDTKIIRIYQINQTVINNIAPNKKNHNCSKYTLRNPKDLPSVITDVCYSLRGISKEKFFYIFDHLDQAWIDSGLQP